MRLFAAVELSEACRQSLAPVARSLQQHTASARLVPAHLAHLTLAFIGERPDARQAAACLGAVQARGFELHLQGAGYFGRLQDAVVWVGVRPSEALNALQEQVTAALGGAGIPVDAKAFHPHVTLARRAVFRSEAQFEAFQRTLPPGPLCSMRAGAFSLLHSHRVQGVLTYTPIARWPL